MEYILQVASKPHRMSAAALAILLFNLLFSSIVLAQVNGDASASCANGVHVVSSLNVAFSVLFVLAYALGIFLVWRHQRQEEVSRRNFSVGMGPDSEITGLE